MIITISGDIGSGKSTVGKAIVDVLKYKYLSTGRIQRKIAKKMGITTLELNILSESQTDIDDKIDAYTKDLRKSKKNYVVDSRLAWHFISSSFKVYLQCNVSEAAKRISIDQTRAVEKSNISVAEVLHNITERRSSERRRFIKKYGIDYTELSNYDLILDTSYITPNGGRDEILKHFKIWQSF